MYRKEVKNSNPSLVKELRRDIDKKNKQIADKDKQIADKDKTIASQKKTIEQYSSKGNGSNPTVQTVYVTDNEAVEKLNKSIASKNQEIRQLEGQVRDLTDKVKWYKENCN